MAQSPEVTVTLITRGKWNPPQPEQDVPDTNEPYVTESVVGSIDELVGTVTASFLQAGRPTVQVGTAKRHSVHTTPYFGIKVDLAADDLRSSAAARQMKQRLLRGSKALVTDAAKHFGTEIPDVQFEVTVIHPDSPAPEPATNRRRRRR